MAAALTLHYRGPLSSCNYTCDYCPFAKEWEEEAVLRADREGLARFVQWAQTCERGLQILFTPWGEALVRKWYRDALVTLSHLPQVTRVAAQTNLSMKLDWLAQADLDSLALWTTWHPTQCTLERYIAQLDRLDALGVGYSVGVVGLREHFDGIRALSERGPLWVNAYKRVADYYTEAERTWLARVDPRFPDNRVYDSLGRACWAGETHLSIDGEGTVRRCHFIQTPLGNLYEDSLTSMLAPRGCSAAHCRCHIGYVHLKELGLYGTYGGGLMERRVLTDVV